MATPPPAPQAQAEWKQAAAQATAHAHSPWARRRALLGRAWSGGWRVLNGAWQLRGIRRGRWCTVRGQLVVGGRARITLGNRVKVWGHIAKTQLSAGPNGRLSIGDHTFINVGCVLSGHVDLRIGRHCNLGPQVMIMDYDFHGVHGRPAKGAPIHIGDHVWLAARCMVLKGVTIGDHAVIGAGAIVTQDVPPYGIVRGEAAKLVRVGQPQGQAQAN